MPKRIKIERKYCLEDYIELMEKIESKKFRKIVDIEEKDEYFTDPKGEYLKDGNCLKLRITNNEKVKLTCKGKIKNFDYNYKKIEKNIDINIKDYEKLAEILSLLGYKSYLVVNKTSHIYTKKKGGIEYNIIIFNFGDWKSFVKFEVIIYNSKKDANRIFEEYIKEMNVENWKVVIESDIDIVKKYKEKKGNVDASDFYPRIRHDKLEKMSLEERQAFEKWVKEIEKRFLEYNDAERTERFMRGYSDDFLEFWKDDWDLNAVATGIEMGYL